MRAKSYTPCIEWRIALIAATLTVGACDAFNEADNSGDGPNVHYHLSLGDSLAVGVQPNSSGLPLPSDNGYADQLYSAIKPAFDSAETQARNLQLIKLGCPGETLDKMTNGGSCPYVAGSQLDAAVDFLTDNAGQVYLVTIDIGGNDFRNAGCIDTTVVPNCANTVSTQIFTELSAVLTALRDAAGPDTVIVGMNYYNPFLASWLEDAAGQTLAVESAQAVGVLNDFLGMAYTTAGSPVADVALAFASNDFTTMVASSQPPPNEILPLSVNNICEFTYMCDADPVGPDIHANNAGYSLIADTFAAVLP